jgi:hypothetical protein
MILLQRASCEISRLARIEIGRSSQGVLRDTDSELDRQFQNAKSPDGITLSWC